MALVITFTPGESFDEEGDTITLNKLNRVINSGTGTISSGSIDTDNVGDLQITAAKLEDILDLSGKTVTLPVGIDLSKGVATGDTVALMDTPTHLGQIGVLTSGKLFISKGIESTADWVYGGYLTVTGDIADLDEVAEESPGPVSSFGIPDAVGQWAIDSNGITYRATGTNQEDWSPIRSHTFDLRDQLADDPAGLIDHIRLYSKGGSLYLVKGGGAVVQVTGQGGVESIYKRFVDTTGTGGPQTLAQDWDNVVFNQEAGVAPDGDFPWYEAYDAITGKISLAAGTYDYSYTLNVWQQSSTGGSSGNSYSDSVRGMLRNIPAPPLGESDIIYSESLTGAGQTDQHYSAWNHNTTIGMEGRFFLVDPTNIALRTYSSAPPGGGGSFRWGRNEGTPNTRNSASGLDDVHAYLRITKVNA